MLIHVLEGCQKKCNSYLAQWALDGSSSRRRQVRWVRCRDFGGCWIVWWETPCSDLLCSISSTAAIRSSAAPYVEVMVPNWIRRGWLAPNGFHGFVELRRRLLFWGKREAPRCNSHSWVGFSSKTTENQNEFYPNEFVRSDSELISSWLGLDHLRSEWNQLQFESNFRRCSMTRAANQSWWLWTGFVRVDWFATDSWFLRSLFFSFFLSFETVGKQKDDRRSLEPCEGLSSFLRSLSGWTLLLSVTTLPWQLPSKKNSHRRAHVSRTSFARSFSTGQSRSSLTLPFQGTWWWWMAGGWGGEESDNKKLSYLMIRCDLTKNNR